MKRYLIDLSAFAGWLWIIKHGKFVMSVCGIHIEGIFVLSVSMKISLNRRALFLVLTPLRAVYTGCFQAMFSFEVVRWNAIRQNFLQFFLFIFCLLSKLMRNFASFVKLKFFVFLPLGWLFYYKWTQFIIEGSRVQIHSIPNKMGKSDFQFFSSISDLFRI